MSTRRGYKVANKKRLAGRITLRMKTLGVSSVEELAKFSPDELKARNFGRDSIRAVYEAAKGKRQQR